MHARVHKRGFATRKGYYWRQQWRSPPLRRNTHGCLHSTVRSLTVRRITTVVPSGVLGPATAFPPRVS